MRSCRGPRYPCRQHTDEEHTGSVAVPGAGMAGGRVQVPLCHRESRTLCKNPAQVGAKLDASRWPCLLGAGPVPSLPAGWGGVAVVVTDPPQAAGTRESPAALSFPWLSTLTFPFPSISLLPAAARGGGQGGAAADGQPDLFPPPSLSSQPSPPQHSSGTYEYLYLPVCSESLDTIRTLKSARGGCPVRGAPVAPGRQMRVKGRAWSIRGEDRGHQPPGFLKFGLKKAQRSLLSCAGHQISRARGRRCCVAIALPPCCRCTAAAQSPGEIPLPPAAPSPEPWPHPDAS